MTNLMMVLLALVVLGVIGVLLAWSSGPGRAVRLRAARRNAAHPKKSWSGHRWDFRRRRLP